MPEFMILIHESEAADATLATMETRSLLEMQAAYDQKLRSLSAYVDGERLRPSTEGRRVSDGEGGPRVDAGPFDEPALEAYYVIRAGDLDAAIDVVKAFPMPQGAAIEVRPVMTFE